MGKNIDLSDITLEEKDNRRWAVNDDNGKSIQGISYFNQKNGYEHQETADIGFLKVGEKLTTEFGSKIERLEDEEEIFEIEKSDMKDWNGRSFLSISEVLYNSKVAWRTESRKIKGKTIVTFEAKGGEDITYILIFNKDNQLLGVNFVWGTEDLAQDEKIKDFFVADAEMNSCIVQTDGLFDIERTVEEINKIAFDRANNSKINKIAFDRANNSNSTDIEIEKIKISLTIKYGEPESGTANWSGPAWRVCDLKNSTDKNCGVFVVFEDDNTFSVVEKSEEDDMYKFRGFSERIIEKDELFEVINRAVKENTKNAKEKKLDKLKISSVENAPVLPIIESKKPTAQQISEFLEKEVIVNEEEIELIKLVLENQIKKYDELISSAIGSEIKQSIMKERTKMNSIIDKIRNRSSLS